MLTKIRTDIRKTFSSAECLLVNTNLFIEDHVEDPVFSNTWKLNFDNLISDLNNLGINIVFYNYLEDECPYIMHRYDHIKQNGHLIFKPDEYPDILLNHEKFVIIAFEIKDVELINKAAFSIVPNTSDLELKMIASYVSNFNNQSVFIEIGNLLYGSKN